MHLIHEIRRHPTTQPNPLLNVDTYRMFYGRSFIEVFAHEQALVSISLSLSLGWGAVYSLELVG